MITLKTFPDTPYFDDFTVPGADGKSPADKNYLRILFRPGVAVQARELTQLQTALQEQISRLGQHIFKEGSPVLGGQPTLENKVDWVRISVPGGATHTVTKGDFLKSPTTEVEAKVVDITTDGTDTLYFIRYTRTGSDTTTKYFQPNQQLIWLKNETLTGDNSVVANVAAANATGKGARVSVNAGVFFVKGCFVYAEANSIIISKDTSVALPSARVVYRINHLELSEAEDVTLVDNAAGSPNFTAPGARRYSIQLTLTYADVDVNAARTTGDEDIIQLLLIQNGAIQVSIHTDYNELADVMAQRTYEESGNYAVSPFQINIREHLNDNAGNGGLYLAGDAAKLAVGIEPAVAYVNGYRVQLEDTLYLDCDKARDAALQANAASYIKLGSYFDMSAGDTMSGLPDINTYTPVVLRNAAFADIGSCRIRAVVPLSSTLCRFYLFDVTVTAGSFADVRRIGGTSAALGYGYANTPTGWTLQSTASSTSIIRLPQRQVKSLANTSNVYGIKYSVVRQYSRTTSSGSFTIAPSTDEVFSSANAADWIVVDNNGVRVTPTIALDGTTHVATLSGLANNVAHTVIARSDRSSAGWHPRSKTLTETNVATDLLVAVPGGGWTAGYKVPLVKSDILAVTVWQSGNVSTSVDATRSDTDISSRFTLDNGQRDTFYALGSITLRPGATLPVGKLRIKITYYSHSTDGDFFCVNSYPDQNSIPSFQSVNGLIPLRDALDFRPTQAADGAFTNAAACAAPDSVFTTNVFYYVPRIDKVYVDKNGKFGILKGIPANDPSPPNDPKDGMVLYQLFIPAYTSSASAVIPTFIDNKRFTMRDIGRIEKRIDNIEYYTALSMLEKETASRQVVDSAGNTQYKNGFIVDSFYGHSIGAVSNPDYACAIDRTVGVLRAPFSENNVRLAYRSAHTDTANVTRTGALLTLAIDSTVQYIAQPYATTSEFVNPYDVYSWSGGMTLSPTSDEWKETIVRPDVIIDNAGNYDSLVGMPDETAAIGTVWNEWQTNWTGTPVVTKSAIDRWEVDVAWLANPWIGNPNGSGVGVRGDGSWGELPAGMSPSGIWSVTDTVTSVQQGQTRSGIRTEIIPDTVLRKTDERVVDTTVVPFIRSRKIYFRANGLKPNTRVWAFFDKINVTGYVQAESFVSYPTSTEVASYLGQTLTLSAPLVTSSTGEITGSFVIPNNSTLKFKTGARVFRLSDSSTDTPTEVTTWAESVYDASGLIESKQANVISTQVPRVVRTEIADTRVITTTTAGQTPKVWVDPLAQSFLVDLDGGIFATSIDLFFADIGTEPVTLEIRTMENGIPTGVVVPLSVVTLPVASLNTWDPNNPGVNSTRFTFESPIYLMQGLEYAFVVKSNSNRAKLWVSELGGKDLSNPSYTVTKQPYAGSMFKSQNASTWTPEQTQDIKFAINRAVFHSTGSAVLSELDLPSKNLIANPITTTTSTLTVWCKNHGHAVGDLVTIAGATTFNGATSGNVNKTHTITAVTADTFTAPLAGATAGICGGDTVTTTTCVQYNTFNLQAQDIVLPGTALDWQVKTSTLATPHSLDTYYSNVKQNDNTLLTSARSLLSVPNYSGPMPKSFIARANLSTTKTNISPVIDLNRCSLITVSNRINSPASVLTEETSAGGSALARYITRKVDLNDPADSLKVYLQANQPTNTSILVFYKTLAAGSGANFESMGWTLLAPVSPVPTTDGIHYSEVEYTAAAPSFSSFAVKIVLTSTNTSIIPTVKDLRCIAVT